MTSHDVVARCRKRFDQRQVGHAGTLDPDATGILILGLGRATRLMRFVTGLPKSYDAEVVLGLATSTLDSSGEVLATYDMAGVTLADVTAAAAGLVGEIDQIPPMVSAIKIGGRRLHEMARAGEEVDRPPRRVVVTRFEVAEVDAAPGVYRIGVDCSSGTYVRTLAADLGTSLGGGAHLRNLRRTAVGPFGLDEAVGLDDLSGDHVLAPVEALRGMSRYVVTDEMAVAVSHGVVLDRSDLGVPDDPGDEGPWAVLDHAGDLMAVYEALAPGRAKPTVVVAI